MKRMQRKLFIHNTTHATGYLDMFTTYEKHGINQAYFGTYEQIKKHQTLHRS